MTWKSYVEHRDDGFWILGSRVSLDSIVYAFRNGQTAEGIVQAFDTLSLEEVYGGITFYLANRDEIDAYLAEQRVETERLYQASRSADPSFYEKIETATRLRKSA